MGKFTEIYTRLASVKEELEAYVDETIEELCKKRRKRNILVFDGDQIITPNMSIITRAFINENGIVILASPEGLEMVVEELPYDLLCQVGAKLEAEEYTFTTDEL